MALIFLAAIGCQCSTTLRWIRSTFFKRNSQTKKWRSSTNPIGQPSVGISHSMPDLHNLRTRYNHFQEKQCKKVLRQTTLPTVPARHEPFCRRLSNRLDVPRVRFSICTFEKNGDFNLGLIKPELYKSEKKRSHSTDSNSSLELECCGKLHLALRYDAEIEGLVVKVLGARDLPVKDLTGSSDPYIRIYLLPDRKKKFQTKVHRKNLNPVFNETFIFSVNYEELRQRDLQFSVYDFDRLSGHNLIGNVVLKGLLDATDLHQEIEYTMNILNPREKKHLGEIMLSLCYLPKAGRLTLTVIKAKNLKAKDINSKSDPYVKVYLVYEKKRIKKKKTSVKKSTLCPVYNEALIFDVPQENIEDVCLIVKVLDHDIVGENKLLGCTALGSDFVGVDRDHWMEMLDNPRRPVARWHTLAETVPGENSFDFSKNFFVGDCLGDCFDAS